MKLSLWGDNSLNYECPAARIWVLITLRGNIDSLENTLRQINEKIM